MGTYTTIEVKCTLRPTACKYIRELHEHHDWKKLRHEGTLTDDLPWYVNDWATVGRCNFIPFGALSYTDWAEEGFSRLEAKDEFSRADIWHFMSSIKNYGGEVEHFLQNILPNLIQSLEICRTQHEEAREETRWVLRNGKIIMADEADKVRPFVDGRKLKLEG